MPKYARGSEIDLDEAYGPLLEKHAPMRRNIRTKTEMHSTHHCEDKECGGKAPKAKCITKLHFAFCLAPVVDEDPESPTFGRVVIHGERFAVISPGGCAEHPYRADYNLDLKDARNGRPGYQIRWKKIFEDFRVIHDASKEREAEKLKSIQLQMSLTGHQQRTLLARQDNIEYGKRRQLEAASRTRSIMRDMQEDTASVNLTFARLLLRTRPRSISEAARHLPEIKASDPGELALSIDAVTAEGLGCIFAPLWLYSELFRDIDAGRSNGGDLGEWAAVVLNTPQQSEPAMPTSEWLQNELFPKVDASRDEIEPNQAIIPSSVEVVSKDEESTRGATDSNEVRPRRKEIKQAKKQRAADTRAQARSIAEEREVQEAKEKEFAQAMQAQKGLLKKAFSRRGVTSFA